MKGELYWSFLEMELTVVEERAYCELHVKEPSQKKSPPDTLLQIKWGHGFSAEKLPSFLVRAIEQAKSVTKLNQEMRWKKEEEEEKSPVQGISEFFRHTMSRSSRCSQPPLDDWWRGCRRRCREHRNTEKVFWSQKPQFYSSSNNSSPICPSKSICLKVSVWFESPKWWGAPLKYRSWCGPSSHRSCWSVESQISVW